MKTAFLNVVKNVFFLNKGVKTVRKRGNIAFPLF